MSRAGDVRTVSAREDALKATGKESAKGEAAYWHAVIDQAAKYPHSWCERRPWEDRVDYVFRVLTPDVRLH